MKTLFDIGSERKASGEHTLLLEIGRECCCYAFLHRPTKTIDRIFVSATDEFQLDNQVKELLQSLKGNTFNDVVVCSAFPQALLFPHKYFTSDYTALDVIYEQPAQKYFHDLLPEWQMVNAYSLPDSVYASLEESFSSVRYVHCYTPAIRVPNDVVADAQLSVHFSEQYIRVLLKKDMHVHLAQTYAYKTPLDVIYYLLKICYEFGLSQQEVVIILSGLVEKDSNLFTDVQQYFTQILFAGQPEIGLPSSPHPHYFFTSIYNLAACVS
ncbi:DUF3822 family protein [Flavisolibacter nicotianae]|uniref:DUF3822 family protein n=1 Tax=Flavisolibacter nicotianae TaxID=2364882 RepID=UPI0013C43B84|nr:DUF3822 family protein [Flavisolibacter nicotianae]